jgi:hypothetical protein
MRKRLKTTARITRLFSLGDEIRKFYAEVLFDGRPITFSTLGRIEIHSANHHRQRHGVDFDRQRCAIPAAWDLETSSFQTLCPNHKTITIPKQYLAPIPRAIHEDKIVAAENIHAERMGDD